MENEVPPLPSPKSRLSLTSTKPPFGGGEGIDYHHFAAGDAQRPDQEFDESIVVKKHQPLKPKTGLADSEIGQADHNEGPRNIAIEKPPSAKPAKLPNIPRPKANKARSSVPMANVGSSSGNIYSRSDNSLGRLAIKFLDLIKHAEDGILELSKAADTLEVNKRRIYDITNVLEGIGLIEKKNRNKIQWKGRDEYTLSNLQEAVKNLNIDESRLDEQISEVQEKIRGLTEDENDLTWLFVTKEDIKSLPGFEHETLIAIKAPQGTSVRVPDPDEPVGTLGKYRIILRSTRGPINLYLVSPYENTNSQPIIPERSSANEKASAPFSRLEIVGNESAMQRVEDQRMGSTPHDTVSKLAIISETSTAHDNDSAPSSGAEIGGNETDMQEVEAQRMVSEANTSQNLVCQFEDFIFADEEPIIPETSSAYDNVCAPSLWPEIGGNETALHGVEGQRMGSEASTSSYDIFGDDYFLASGADMSLSEMWCNLDATLAFNWEWLPLPEDDDALASFSPAGAAMSSAEPQDDKPPVVNVYQRRRKKKTASK